MKRLLLLYVAVVLSTGLSFAQDADSLAFVSADWKTEKLPRGAVAMTARIELFGSHQTVSVVRYRSGRFYTRIVQTRDLTPTSTTAKGLGAVAAVNAGYWNVRKVEPSTYVRIDGHDCSRTESAETFRVNGILTISKRKLDVFECDTTRYGYYAVRYDNILASGPVLIDDGREFDYSDRTEKFFRRHPRSVIGSTARGEVVMIAVDGRFKGDAEGMTVDELVKVCRWLGLVDAINLDGGGSTTLWNSVGGIMNHPYDNKRYDHEGERAVSSCIVALP